MGMTKQRKEDKMLTKLPFNVTKEEMEQAVRNIAKPFWFVKKRYDVDSKYVLGNGVDSRLVAKPSFLILFKPFPLVFATVELVRSIDCLMVISFLCSMERITLKVCKELERIKRDQAKKG